MAETDKSGAERWTDGLKATGEKLRSAGERLGENTRAVNLRMLEQAEENAREAFRAMRQSRILELLSLGLISDEDAAIELTGNLPPAGAPKLSGTNFKGGNSQVNPNPLSNTANSTPQDMNPQTPTQAKSQNRKKEAQK